MGKTGINGKQGRRRIISNKFSPTIRLRWKMEQNFREKKNLIHTQLVRSRSETWKGAGGRCKRVRGETSLNFHSVGVSE